MTIQQAIQKALEEGWIPKVQIDNSHPIDSSIFLDPLFWQSLGKSLGWKKKLYPLEPPRDDHYSLCGWKYHWHRLIDHIASRKSIESFFEELK